MSTVRLGHMRSGEFNLDTDNTVNAGILYQVKKSRRTHAFVQVIDLRPLDLGKFALRCVTHGTVIPRATRLPAEAECHKSDTWCPSCTVVEKASPQKVARRIITIDASPDEVRSFANMMPTVTWGAKVAPAPKRRRRTAKKVA